MPPGIINNNRAIRQQRVETNQCDTKRENLTEIREETVREAC